MKKLLIFGALALSSVVLAESNVGTAYGQDVTLLTNHKTVAKYDYWVAGTESGLLFGKFLFFDSGNGPGSSATFRGARLHSFKCYSDPFYGRVADFTMEGYFDQDLAFHGRLALARVVVSDSDFGGFPGTVGYFAIYVSLPNAPGKPIFSRMAATTNKSHILCKESPGPLAGGQGFSDKGLAYTERGSVNGVTNRLEPAAALYNVAYNYLYQFIYQDAHLGMVGKRVRSFQCTNSGPFGETAEFWLDVLAGDSYKTAGTNRVARVIVTESNSPFAWDLMYVALYHPGNLSVPIYERLVFITSGQNKILCK